MVASPLLYSGTRDIYINTSTVDCSVFLGSPRPSLPRVSVTANRDRRHVGRSLQIDCIFRFRCVTFYLRYAFFQLFSRHSLGYVNLWHFVIQAITRPVPAEPAGPLTDVELLLVTIVVDPVVIITVDVGVRTSLDGHAVLVAQAVVRFLKWHSVSVHPVCRGRYVCV